MDLIDREVARTIICEKCENYSTVCEICKLTECGGWCRVFSLYSVPTVDAKPVRHGRWIMLEPYGAHHTHRRKCSECGEIKAKELTNFCPNCGADMREENVDNG